MAASVRTMRGRFASAVAVTGLVTVAGLGLSGAPAQAEPGGSGQAQLIPSQNEWWLGSWQVQQKVWPLTQGEGVTVAVVDSGVQARIPDLRGVVLPGTDTTGAGGTGDTDFYTSEDGHGTAVSVLIAGQGSGTGTVGIAPRARILPVQVDYGGGNPDLGSSLSLAAGIRYAAGHGAQVINMSLGGDVSSPHACDPVLQAAIAYALARNVVLIAGAGDTNVTGPGPIQPASCAGVLAVGGVEPNGTLWRYSTQEPYVAVTAPGDRVTYVGKDGRYTTTGWGTSFSSALISGAAALIRSRYPHMPWYQVDQRLTGTAIPAGRTVPNAGFGYGIVNLARAVNASAYPLSPAAPDPVYARFKAWLATPGGRAFAVQYGLAGQNQTPASRAVVVSAQPQAGGSGRSPAGPANLTLEEIVITAVAVACVFVAALVLTLRMSARRRGVPPGNWGERPGSFGPGNGGAYPGAPGYGRPTGYGPPPLWGDTPQDSR